MISAAIHEAVATGFDGTIRLAPALPSNWSVSGTVYVQGKSKVHVQFVSGALVFGVARRSSLRPGKQPCRSAPRQERPI